MPNSPARSILIAIAAFLGFVLVMLLILAHFAPAPTPPPASNAQILREMDAAKLDTISAPSELP